jgi:nucleoside-diphosphate-sugar epimerase
LIDTVYVDNAADAHVLAADRLWPRSKVSGKAYFITQGEPAPLWDVVNDILNAAGLPPVRRSVPTALAIFAGAVLELAYAVAWPDAEPPMTRFLAHELSTAHWFNIDAARTDLDYRPRVSTEEGLHLLADWFRSQDVSSSNAECT